MGGTTLKGVNALLTHNLAHWEGENFILHDYDTDGEIRFQTRSMKGRAAAQERWKRAAMQDARAYAVSNARAYAVSNARAYASGQDRPSVPDPSDPPRKDFGTNPKPLPRQEGAFLAVAIDRVEKTWPWRETFFPEKVKLALKRFGRDRIDEIIAGMKRDTANPKWRQKNPFVTAASYIRGGQWKTELKKPAPKNGASNGKPAKPAIDHAAELEDLKRDFAKAFPGEKFPGREKAWPMLTGLIGRNLGDQKSIGKA